MQQGGGVAHIVIKVVFVCHQTVYGHHRDAAARYTDTRKRSNPQNCKPRASLLSFFRVSYFLFCDSTVCHFNIKDLTTGYCMRFFKPSSCTTCRHLDLWVCGVPILDIRRSILHGAVHMKQATPIVRWHGSFTHS